MNPKIFELGPYLDEAISNDTFHTFVVLGGILGALVHNRNLGPPLRQCLPGAMALTSVICGMTLGGAINVPRLGDTEQTFYLFLIVLTSLASLYMANIAHQTQGSGTYRACFFLGCAFSGVVHWRSDGFKNVFQNAVCISSGIVSYLANYSLFESFRTNAQDHPVRDILKYAAKFF